MKRLVSFLTAILMLASIFAIPVTAADRYLSATITGAKEAFERGETIEVIFGLHYAGASDTLGATFTYDEDVLTLVNNESSSNWLLTGGLGNVNYANKQGAYAILGDSKDLSGDILKLTFTVNDDADFGESDISCEILVKQGATQLVKETIIVRIDIACVNHNFIEKVDAKYENTKATCSNVATYFKSCEVCGIAHETDTFEYGTIADHDYSNSEWESLDDDSHIRYCANYDTCGNSETLAHDWTSVCDEVCDTCDHPREVTHTYIEEVADKYLASEATCSKFATYYKSCEVCGKAHETETFEYGTIADHDYSNSEWESLDDNSHIRYCANYATCGNSETLAHDWTNTCDEVCDTCDHTREVTHTYIEEVADKYLASEATCSKFATYYKSCEVCGKAHETDTFEYGTTADHDYSNSEWESLDDNNHIRYCANYDTCGNSEILAHDWTNTCDEVCDTCGHTRVVKHSYIKNPIDEYKATDADCMAPATYYWCCEVCYKANETETFEHGELGDHDYSNSEWESLDDDSHIRYCEHYGNGQCLGSETVSHSWTMNCDEVCDDCGHTRVVTHNYDLVNWRTNSREHWHACRDCGGTTDLGAHVYEGNRCLVCGQRKQADNQIISGYIYVNETYHMILIGNGVITTEHVIDANGDCILCLMHIKDMVEEGEIIVEVEDPVEPSTEEEEDVIVEEAPEEAPATGIALGLAALAASALAVVVSKRR